MLSRALHSAKSLSTPKSGSLNLKLRSKPTKRELTGISKGNHTNSRASIKAQFTRPAFNNTRIQFKRSFCSDGSQNVVLKTSGTFSSPRPTHKCGELTSQHVGTTVGLTGWLSSIRFLSQTLAFIALRDSIGTTQIKIELPAGTTDMSVIDALKNAPLESILYVKGVVQYRPSNTVNTDMTTGEIEIQATELEVLNRADNLPLPYHRNDIEVANEDVRLKYRYLDLRQPNLQRNIRLRSKALQATRQYLVDQGFCEIETPTLFRKTSEGAREYIVPTRNPNKFYTLTQSPQQYKQLLMASGFDRYFQVARCYRDEDLRADRQPEFTQIDMELAFIQQEDIMRTIEGLIASIWKQCLGINLPTPFPKHTYQWCMENYGSDKPDTRFDIKLNEISDIFGSTQVGIFKQALSTPGSYIKAINIKGIGKMSEKDIDALQQEAKKSSPGVITAYLTEEGKLKSSVSKYLSEEEISRLKKRLDIQNGDMVVIASGVEEVVFSTLGRLRLWARDKLIQKGVLNIPADRFDLFWVIDFPLFTWEEGKMLSTHHPFTAPVSEDAHLLSTHPEKVRGQHYDVVLNGYEIGGGSIRIHKKEEQIRVLRDVLKMAPEKVAEFQHLLDALGHGCPPHGGIALGFDRLMAVAVGAKSLREVIAFPKSTSGAELMTGAPAALGDAELDELFKIVKAAKDQINSQNKS